MQENKITNFIVNKNRIIAKYLLILVIIFAISRLFPRNQFIYDFALGKPWSYETLLAPFDFAIKKSEETINAEKSEITKDFVPFYVLDEGVPDHVLGHFIAQFSREYQNWQEDSLQNRKLEDSTYYISLGEEWLTTLYEVGIIMLSDEHKQAANTPKEINLLEGNTSRKRRIADFYDPIKACDYVKKQVDEQVIATGDTSVLWLTSILCPNIKHNIEYDVEWSEKVLLDSLSSISDREGLIQEGQSVIAQGKVVEEKDMLALQSLKEAYEGERISEVQYAWIDGYLLDIGYFGISFLVIGIFVLFISLFEQSVFKSMRKLTFVLLLIFAFLYLISFSLDVQKTNAKFLNLYALPFCVVPIITKTFFGSIMAHYVFVTIILLAGFMVPLGYDFLFLHFLAGLIAILANVRTYYWSHFFIATAFIFGTYSIGYLAISLIQEPSIYEIKWGTYGWLLINAFFTLLAYPLIPIFEKIFGFISDITLVELGDVSRPVLKKLSKRAPGSFWHSMQVANLAETAAAEIGANALLAKVGALYHDIGKMQRPVYFIENQKTKINPHDDLPYEESAKIIISHVTDGIELAKKEGLPNIIIDFIRTHHGNTRTEYFYRKYCQQYPNKEVDDRLFRYPGPLPYSKETAIVMIADSIEAASRSLKSPSEEDINRLVDNIIDGKIKQNQFVNCDISFKNINTIRKVFKRQLKSIYHIRISYPSF